jgi:hypothetical protein
MNLGTHVSDGERRTPIDIEVCRSKVKVATSKNRTKIGYYKRAGNKTQRHTNKRNRLASKQL